MEAVHVHGAVRKHNKYPLPASPVSIDKCQCTVGSPSLYI